MYAEVLNPKSDAGLHDSYSTVVVSDFSNITFAVLNFVDKSTLPYISNTTTTCITEESFMPRSCLLLVHLHVYISINTMCYVLEGGLQITPQMAVRKGIFINLYVEVVH